MPSPNSPLNYLRQIAIGSATGLLLLILIIGGFTLAAPNKNGATNTPTSTPTDTPTVTPTAEGRDCSVAELALDDRLVGLHAQVINPATNEVLFDIQGDTPAQTASVMKLLTATAALQVLGPNYRIQTKVYADLDIPGQIVIVGAGDPTLSRVRAGVQSVYKDAPKLSDLAVQINEWARATPITSIVLDSTYFAEEGWDPGNPESERTIGYQSLVSALQVDGDRISPAQFTSARTGRPVLSAGEAFKKELGDFAKTAILVESETPAGFIEIGSVQSQPMSRWITYILQRSENIQSEMMAKLVSVDLGFDGSFESFDPAFKRALGTTGLDFTGVRIRDASGLSQLNMVSPKFMAELMRLVNSEFADFGQIKRSLSIAGESGTLGSRFKGDIADAAGDIFAKNGYIIGVHTLNGIINAKDGTVLTFAIYALGDTGSDVRTAIDTLATAFYRCGDDLSNE
jgi:D-alanyl-D-alanine carboxypeptidase/D-alanyl-D-alanine-endopeptidase (penicillin-binding protein 4)